MKFKCQVGSIWARFQLGAAQLLQGLSTTGGPRGGTATSTPSSRPPAPRVPLTAPRSLLQAHWPSHHGHRWPTERRSTASSTLGPQWVLNCSRCNILTLHSTSSKDQPPKSQQSQALAQWDAHNQQYQLPAQGRQPSTLRATDPAVPLRPSDSTPRNDFPPWDQAASPSPTQGSDTLLGLPAPCPLPGPWGRVPSAGTADGSHPRLPKISVQLLTVLLSDWPRCLPAGLEKYFYN